MMCWFSVKICQAKFNGFRTGDFQHPCDHLILEVGVLVKFASLVIYDSTTFEAAMFGFMCFTVRKESKFQSSIRNMKSVMMLGDTVFCPVGFVEVLLMQFLEAT